MSEIELSRDEDSVSSLANLAIKDGLITFAGVNSAPSDIASGKNEHLRSFKINYPAKRRHSQERAQASIGMVGKAALFSPGGPKSEVYQRIIRLSPVQRRDTPSKRIGAVATGLGGLKNEVVVFDATFSEPAASHVIQRIVPAGGDEAADLAITELQKELFSLVYCTDHDVYATAISYDFELEKPRGALSDPRAVYTIPHPHAASKSARPTFRALRFLTSEYLLLLTNLPGRTGVELLVLRLFPSTAGEIVARKVLPKRMKAATGLDVCMLDADAKTGARQIVVAVVGQDITVEVMTIDYLGTKENAMGKFYKFVTLRDVHPHQMTGVVFSPFQAPRSSSSRSDKPTSRPSTPVEKEPQFLRLATVSMGNTVVVDHFQLTEISASPAGSVRHVLSTARARFMYSSSVVLLVSAIALVSAVIIQAVLGASSGTSDGTLSVQDGIRSLLYGPGSGLLTSASSSSSSSLSIPSSAPSNSYPASSQPSLMDTDTQLRTLLSQRLLNSQTQQNPQQQAIVLRPHTGTKPSSNIEGQIAAEIHADLDAFTRANTARSEAKAKAKAKLAQKATTQKFNPKSTADDNNKGDNDRDENDGNVTDDEDNDSEALLKSWDELSEHDRGWWTERLREAGAWVADEGEAVLKGVFFAEIRAVAAGAAAVAAAAGGRLD